MPRSQLRGWDIFTEVLVAGSGAAGVCAAIEARSAGAGVLLLDSLPRPGGVSAMSAGVIYAGGGTALQRALGIEDSTEAMYEFLLASGSRYPQLDKLQRYCEGSPAHFDWLFELGVPYQRKLSQSRGVPRDDASLYYSGNERAWPARDVAAPAPRGHLPGIPGINGGRALMEILLRRARTAGVGLQADAVLEQLVVERDGRVAGAIVRIGGVRQAIRAGRGVVLCCGGFILNREMVANHMPDLLACSAPWGGPGDLGSGLLIGAGVGAAARRLHEGAAVLPLGPPDLVLGGIVVDASGQRFIAEDSFPGVLGDAIVRRQGGRAWLITDHASSFPDNQDGIRQVAIANSLGNLASQLAFPRGALQNTVAYYNRNAANGEDPQFRKGRKYLRPLQGPPYRAWNLAPDQAFCAAYSLGGLHTAAGGEVLNAGGEPIPGLFAAGRATAGVPGAPYVAEGLSLGDSTFFGRLAGASAAARSAS